MNIAFAGFRHYHIYGLFESAVAASDVTVTGCFEANDEARVRASALGAQFTYDSCEELLADDSVEAVAIGDYYGIRGQLVIKALKAGKHVICDKPVCTDLSELSEIERLSEEKNLQVCCMLDLRYMAQAAKAKEIVESGSLGRIVNVNFTGQHCLDYGNRPGWYYEEGKHGGTINDIAIHGVDLIRMITGKDLTKVNCARVWNAFAEAESQFCDCGQFMAEFGDMSVMADVSYAAPKFSGTLPTYWDFYFWGTKGMMNFRLSENVIHIYKDTEEIIPCESDGTQYLRDFILETQGEKTIMNTKGILKTQRQMLLIQNEA